MICCCYSTVVVPKLYFLFHTPSFFYLSLSLKDKLLSKGNWSRCISSEFYVSVLLSHSRAFIIKCSLSFAPPNFSCKLLKNNQHQKIKRPKYFLLIFLECIQKCILVDFILRTTKVRVFQPRLSSSRMWCSSSFKPTFESLRKCILPCFTGQKSAKWWKFPKEQRTFLFKDPTSHTTLLNILGAAAGIQGKLLL